MTWSEIKKAVEQVGVGEEEEISLIQLGRMLKLAENASAEKARKDAEGCAV
jgi:hypothetical protein